MVGTMGVVKVRRRRLVIAAAVVVVLTAGAVLSGVVWWRWDTSRQPQVNDVVSVMRRAVADTVVAAGQDAAVAAGGVVRSAVCRLGLFREGGVFTASADLYTDPGAEDDLITRIEQRMSAAYPVTRGPAAVGVRPLQVDTGSSVTVSVRRLSAGWLSVTARSRCSLGAEATSTDTSTGTTGRAALAELLGRLGSRPATWREHRLPCRDADLVTVSAVSAPTDTGNLQARLTDAIPSGAEPFASGEANRVAYRDGAVSIVVAAVDDGTAVTVQHTISC